MKRYFLAISFSISTVFCLAQNVYQKLDNDVKILLKDEQMKHAVMSFYVVDEKGKILYDLNSQVGLAPASTQKIFTSIAALELLGENYKYETELGYDGLIKNDSLSGFIFLRSYGDPTFGSWRYNSTKPDTIFKTFANEIKKSGIKVLSDSFFIDESKFDLQIIPGGWIWEDIGNYYGAGARAFNWKENQYDVVLASSNKPGDNVNIVSVDGKKKYLTDYKNELKSAPAGSGDNSYIYFPMEGYQYLLNGTIPINEKNFTISGSVADVQHFFLNDFKTYLKNETMLNYSLKRNRQAFQAVSDSAKYLDSGKIIYTYYSPSLDSIIYWFLQRSINLYGEALAKTIAYQKTGFGSTDKGIELIQNFWQQNGIESSALNIMDGSGLSPQNRVTTNAEVTALRYAKNKSWFNNFYNALPTINNMKMKSGVIGGSRAFAGYQTSNNGRQYVFAMIINNFDGSANSIVQKMYKILDELR